MTSHNKFEAPANFQCENISSALQPIKRILTLQLWDPTFDQFFLIFTLQPCMPFCLKMFFPISIYFYFFATVFTNFFRVFHLSKQQKATNFITQEYQEQQQQANPIIYNSKSNTAK